MRKIELSPEAADDILGIWDYIARSNLPAADRIRDKFHNEILTLAQLPGMGHTRADVRDARYRFWTVKPYVIAYRHDASTLTVVRVLHGARDLRKLFGP